MTMHTPSLWSAEEFYDQALNAEDPGERFGMCERAQTEALLLIARSLERIADALSPN